MDYAGKRGQCLTRVKSVDQGDGATPANLREREAPFSESSLVFLFFRLNNMKDGCVLETL